MRPDELDFLIKQGKTQRKCPNCHKMFRYDVEYRQSEKYGLIRVEKCIECGFERY